MLRQELQERDVTVEGEFLSEAQMIEEGFSEQFSLNNEHSVSVRNYHLVLHAQYRRISGRGGKRSRNIAAHGPNN